jgi:ribosomal protein S18 acetylase RimI-like enzyme
MDDAVQQRAIDLVRMKIELEIGGPLVGDSLSHSTDPNDPEPLLLVSHHANGRAIFFRHDVPEAIRAQFRGVSDDELGDEVTVRRILARVAPVEKVVRIRWYTVERTPTPDEFPDVVRRNGRFIIPNGRNAASQAWADCANEHAEEVSVATVPEFRGRGYARQVVTAWMHDVRSNGKTGFYSHLTSNTASQALAASAGVTWLSDEVEYVHTR